MSEYNLTSLKLPKLTGGSLKGLPRIYAITRAILRYQQYLLNTIDLETILNKLQDQVREVRVQG